MLCQLNVLLLVNFARRSSNTSCWLWEGLDMGPPIALSLQSMVTLFSPGIEKSSCLGVGTAWRWLQNKHFYIVEAIKHSSLNLHFKRPSSCLIAVIGIMVVFVIHTKTRASMNLDAFMTSTLSYLLAGFLLVRVDNPRLVLMHRVIKFYSSFMLNPNRN